MHFSFFLCMLTASPTESLGRVVKLLLRIQEVSGSNLNPETGYPQGCFSGFSQSLHVNSGIVLKN
jgi:hypothetical protein